MLLSDERRTALLHGSTSGRSPAPTGDRAPSSPAYRRRQSHAGQVRSGLSAGGRWIRTFGSPTDPLPFRGSQARLPSRFDLPTRNRWFESTSLQRGGCKPSVPRGSPGVLSAVWAAVWVVVLPDRKQYRRTGDRGDRRGGSRLYRDIRSGDQAEARGAEQRIDAGAVIKRRILVARRSRVSPGISRPFSTLE